MSSSSAPVEGKVSASTIGSGAGATASALILWILGVTFWHASTDATQAAAAVAAVPVPVSAAVIGVLTPGLAFLGGYLARHTPRLDEVAAQVALADTTVAPVAVCPTEEPADDSTTEPLPVAADPDTSPDPAPAA